jgi:hypothetical protein
MLERRCTLSLWYRERQRRDRTTVKAVPTRDEADEVASELRRLLSQAPYPRERAFVYLHFASVPQERCERLQRGGRYYFSSTEYPASARHLDHVRLHGLTSGDHPVIGSDLKTGFVGADSGFLRKKLADKAGRSLGLSKDRANGLPLWLVVHSDGRAIHQSMAPPQRQAAVEMCREVLATIDHGFASIFWADSTGFRNAAWVGRII